MNEDIIALKEKINEHRARLQGHKYQADDHLDMHRRYVAQCNIDSDEIKGLQNDLVEMQKRAADAHVMRRFVL